MLSLQVIQKAAEAARPFVTATPLLPLGDSRWLKPELLQPTGSFKVRGFFAAALALPADRRRQGLLTVSAGNAAMACAYVAHRLGVPCRVLMFDSAPPPKVEGVLRWGATPIRLPRQDVLDWLAGRGWEGEPETFIHPFADPALQSGHGGIGLEIASQLPELERVLVAVGGGGLVHGIGSALKAVKPGIEVVGVQSDGYELWRPAIEGGAPPPALVPQTIADGTAAPYDPAMHERLGKTVDRWLTVPEPRLRAAIPELAAAARVVAEGAGALSFAALEQLPPGPATVAVISGGNLDRRLLAALLAG